MSIPLLLTLLVCFWCAPLQAEVEILDGSDTETMKAVFPSLENQDLSGLEKMRQQRLSYEPQCVENKSQKFVTIIFSARFDSAATASAGLESRKTMIKQELASLPLTITKHYNDYEDVVDRRAALQGAAYFLAQYSCSFIAANNEKLFQQLRMDLSQNGIEVKIKSFKECPDGNVI